MQKFFAPHHYHLFASKIRATDSLLAHRAFRQRQNSRLFSAIFEEVKPPNFVEKTNGVESVEITSVVCRELARLKVTTTKICVAKCLRRLPREKMKTQPAAVGRRDALRFSEKCDEQQKNQISVHLRLKLEVARKIFRRDRAHSAFELERGGQRMMHSL